MKRKFFSIADYGLTTEWAKFLVFLFGLALVYIYFSHRTDNIVRDISSTKRGLVELRAENITLKSEIMRKRSRENLEERLKERGVKEPNKAIKVIRKSDGS